MKFIVCLRLKGREGTYMSTGVADWETADGLHSPILVLRKLLMS